MVNVPIADLRRRSLSERTLNAFKDALAPLRQVFEDESVNEIMINGPDEVFIRQGGAHDLRLRVSLPALSIQTALTLLASHVEKTVGKNNLILSARFPGFRVEGVLSPVSLKGPSMCIRRHASRVLSLQEYLDMETVTPAQAEIIRETVATRQNFLVAGSTFSGKTTLMNCILSLVEPHERIFTIEQVPELKIAIENHTPMETDPEQGVTARELVQTAMRYSPNRIILGELRGKEAYDWLDALNTGHPGSGATIHADGAADALQRLESLVMMAESGIPYHAIQQWIGRSLNVVFFIQYRQGKRRLAQVCHLDGFDRSKGEYTTSTINYGESPNETEPAPAPA
jgi:pilus assembly protein CpaF